MPSQMLRLEHSPIRLDPADGLTVTMDTRLGQYFALVDVNDQYAGTLLQAYSDRPDMPSGQHLHLSADLVQPKRKIRFGEHDAKTAVSTVYMGSALRRVQEYVCDRHIRPWPPARANSVASRIASETAVHELSHGGDYIAMGEETLLQEKFEHYMREKRKSSWKLIPDALAWLGSIATVARAGLAVEYTMPSPVAQWGVTGFTVLGVALIGYKYFQWRIERLPNGHKVYQSSPAEQRAETRTDAYREARKTDPPSTPQIITVLLRQQAYQSLVGTKTPR